MVADGQRLVERLLNFVCRVEVVFPGEYDERGMGRGDRTWMVGTVNAGALPMM